MSARAAELEAAGVAFVEATVVRCAAPTSARPGDRAIVLGDGTIEGFVGGSCADATVRLQALRALETGEPVLLRILPGRRRRAERRGGRGRRRQPVPERRRARAVPRAAPAARRASRWPASRRWRGRSCELAGPLGFAARLGAAAEPGTSRPSSPRSATTTRTRCGAALEAGCEYVGLVASRVRGAAVLDALRAEGVPTRRSRACARPPGLDIGARTHAEIALSILAELVAVRRAPAVPSLAPVVAAPREAVDPVCGMTVVVGPDTPMAGGDAFCCEGCREAWLARAG